jgi:hypothetical protein
MALKQRWADDPNVELLRHGRYVDVIPSSYQAKCFFDAARRASHQYAQWSIGGVAPGMSNIPAKISHPRSCHAYLLF